MSAEKLFLPLGSFLRDSLKYPDLTLVLIVHVYLCIHLCTYTYINMYKIFWQKNKGGQDVNYRSNSIIIWNLKLIGLLTIFYYYYCCSILIDGNFNKRKGDPPELFTSWLMGIEISVLSKCNLQNSLPSCCSFRQQYVGKHFTASTVFSMHRRDSWSQLCKCFNWDSCSTIQVIAYSSGPHRPKCIYISMKCPTPTQHFSLEHRHGTWLTQSTR